MSIFKQAVTAFTLFCFVGCATIISGSNDNVNITSEPSGGKVYINGFFVGNTPTVTSLKKDKDYNIEVKKDGYVTTTAMLNRSFNPIFILSFVTVLCWAVDIITGAMWKFDRNHINITLEKVGAKTSSVSKQGRIVAGQNMTAVPYKGKTVIYYNAQPAK